ncbi:hypothetical protein [Halobellus ruber]|uniref:Uncharacterized protein n=1 Tax=Halobellus ruber TaxID=2761102 RepID=A0A7J9SJ86_9EURY|nr:hypothetical protein [Halobellus ruber]MBB6645071.1 hypothetical protein [Halobellus ruber]
MAISRSIIAALIVTTLLLSAGGFAAAQSANETATGSDAEYTIDELRQDGKHYSVPSARIVPAEERIFWLEHTPANQPWRDVTKANNGPKFDTGQTLKTNTLYLRTIRAQTDQESATVMIVSWDRETREVTRGNTTTTEPYAANVTVQEQQVTLGSGWAMGEVELPRHDETKRVTMWVNGHEDTARWTFTHRSVAFTQPIDVGSWSEFVLLATGFIIVPAVAFGAYGGRKVRSWIDRAGAPPGHGLGYYLGVTTVITLGIVFGAYYYAAEVIVTVPFVLGAYVGVVYIGYMLATHEGSTESQLFWKPHIDSVESFTSTRLPAVGSDSDQDSLSFSEDMPFGTMQSYRVLDEGQAGLSIVRNGWLAFLARLKGGRARIENADELRTRFSLWESPWSEVFIIDPDAEELLEYEPPGLRLKTPEVDSWTDLVWPAVLLIGAVVLAWRAAALYGPTVYAALIVAVPLAAWRFAVEGSDSHVHIEPAPAALRPVLASMLVMSVGNRDAHTLDEAEEFAWKALAAQEDVKVEQLRRGTETTVHQAFGAAADESVGENTNGVSSVTPDGAGLADVGDSEASGTMTNGAPAAHDSEEDDDATD